MNQAKPHLENPRLRAFVGEVDRRISQGLESFWSCEGLLLDLARSDVFLEFLELELLRGLDDPRASVPRSSEGMLEVFSSPLWSLLVHIHAPRPAGAPGYPIRSFTEHVLMTILRGTLPLRTHRVPGGAARNEVFNRAVRLEDRTDHVLAVGKALVLPAGDVALEIPPPSTEAVTVSLVRKHVVPLRWGFDSATLVATEATADGASDKRMEFAARILALLPVAQSAEALERMARADARHFVRWTAIRELRRVDAPRAEALLSAALDDPHPHVRNAARRTLDKLTASRVARTGPQEP